MLDIDPPEGAGFERSVNAAKLIRQVLADSSLESAVKTSGAKGLHVVVPIDRDVITVEDASAATRAIAERAERLDPDSTTTAFVKADRGGKVFLDSTRAGGATVVAAYSPRARPGVPVSFPVPWDRARRHLPHRLHDPDRAPVCSTGGICGPTCCPAPQQLPADLIREGHQIPAARVAAMHEGKRRARSSADAQSEK